ncbi:hypothetical protein FH972_026558 [Carpinus fangiana]|uniref:Uncharacterized protein n=1 Tax=Carpinus fangiana TaxID=176857 RepID=A0A5N6L4D5_9ROSI|nr:hypothetical protein FH972_026558 [Carpinus fangiana]
MAPSDNLEESLKSLSVSGKQSKVPTSSKPSAVAESWEDSADAASSSSDAPYAIRKNASLLSLSCGIARFTSKPKPVMAAGDKIDPRTWRRRPAPAARICAFCVSEWGTNATVALAPARVTWPCPPKTSKHTVSPACGGNAPRARHSQIALGSIERTSLPVKSILDKMHFSLSAVAIGLACTCNTVTAATKGVFAHYMVGSITADHANTDVSQAKNIGIDAFALNVGSLLPFATDASTGAIPLLFNAADNLGFKLFFSFDMYALGDTDPSQFLALVSQYQGRSSYYQVDGRPFVSTFNGATKTFGQADANSGWQNAFQNAQVTPYFVPDFDDFNGYPNGIVSAFPYPDGFFSWESAWPASSQGIANVSSDTDLAVISQTQPAGKFKDLDASQFYYRIGELNYGQRIQQLLSAAPDYVEIITWNDAGEGHYIGSFWPEQIGDSGIDKYTNGFDHSGWQQLVPSVIAALKNGAQDTSALFPGGPWDGKAAAGAMWYRPVLTTSSCASGQPSGYQNAQDLVNFAISLPSGASDYKIVVSSGGNVIATFPGQAGLNINSTGGLVAGSAPKVDVVDDLGNTVASATGNMDVAGNADLCNYNYVVTGF